MDQNAQEFVDLTSSQDSEVDLTSETLSSQTQEMVFEEDPTVVAEEEDPWVYSLEEAGHGKRRVSVTFWEKKVDGTETDHLVTLHRAVGRGELVGFALNREKGKPDSAGCGIHFHGILEGPAEWGHRLLKTIRNKFKGMDIRNFGPPHGESGWRKYCFKQKSGSAWDIIAGRYRDAQESKRGRPGGSGLKELEMVAAAALEGSDAVKRLCVENPILALKHGLKIKNALPLLAPVKPRDLSAVLVTISGPSASGKTTMSLAISQANCGDSTMLIVPAYSQVVSGLSARDLANGFIGTTAPAPFILNVDDANVSSSSNHSIGFQSMKLLAQKDATLASKGGDPVPLNHACAIFTSIHNPIVSMCRAIGEIGPHAQLMELYRRTSLSLNLLSGRSTKEDLAVYNAVLDRVGEPDDGTMIIVVPKLDRLEAVWRAKDDLGGGQFSVPVSSNGKVAVPSLSDMREMMPVNVNTGVRWVPGDPMPLVVDGELDVQKLHEEGQRSGLPKAWTMARVNGFRWATGEGGREMVSRIKNEMGFLMLEIVSDQRAYHKTLNRRFDECMAVWMPWEWWELAGGKVIVVDMAVGGMSEWEAMGFD